MLGQHRASLLVLSGSSTGKMFTVSGGTVTVGRNRDCEIHLPDEGVSRHHAVFGRDEEGNVVVTDLGSTNGTYVGGVAVKQRVLKDGDRIEIGTANILKFSYQDTLEETFNLNRYRQAVYDDLTGALNRRHWLKELRQELAYGLRIRAPTSVLLMDVDHFKQVNDAYGHQAGDEILRQLGDTIEHNVREEDVFGRYGGEEFVLLLRGLEEEHAYLSAERVRKLIQENAIEWNGHYIPITISVGIATATGKEVIQTSDLLKQADQHLYTAKRSGRNRTVGAYHPG